MLERPEGFMKVLMESVLLFCQILIKNWMTRKFSQRLEKHIFMELSSAVLDLLHADGRSETKWRSQKTHFINCLPRTHPNSHVDDALCCFQRDRVTFMLSVLPHSTFTVQILYKLYSLQLNCTYSNYTEAAATCSAAQQHSTFTVQILYILQLNCT